VFDEVTYFGGEGEALKADEEHLSYLSRNEQEWKWEEILSRFDVDVIVGAVPILHDLVRLRLSTGLAGGGCVLYIPFWRRKSGLQWT
jgi:hypothetical protein